MSESTVPDEVYAALPDGATLRLCTLAGSRAYGTHRQDSDYDYVGVYQLPNTAFFGLRAPVEHVKLDEPDVKLYELGKFVRLMLACNPNALEVLWGPVLAVDEVGQALRDARSMGLSRQRVLAAYGGYAHSQLKHALSGTGGSRGQAHLRRTKFKLHLLRLLDAGEGLLRTGELQVRVSDPAALWALAEQDMTAVEAAFAERDLVLNDAFECSVLPEKNDYDGLDRLLTELRVSFGG